MKRELVTGPAREAGALARERAQYRLVETSPFPGKTALALVWFVVLAAVAYDGPRRLGLVAGEGSVSAFVRSMMPSSAAGGPAPPLPGALSAAAPSAPPPGRQPADGAPAVAQPIEDFSGESLDGFYRALLRTEGGGGGALTRVVHYGDSMLTGDAISGAVRRRLQERFGDGGHGFILAGRPWPWYSHQGVRLWSSPGFRVNRVTSNPLPDGRLGLGGVAFRSVAPGSRLVIEPKGGGRASRYEVFYLKRPGGGSLTLGLEGLPDRTETVSTAAERLASGFHGLEAPDGSRRLTLSVAGGGEVRLFGVVLERDGPGVVYDSLGINGLHASNFARFDRHHLVEQIGRRAPALIVVMLGTNESQNPELDLEGHGRDMAAMLEVLRAGAPGASCLVVSPPDRARRTGAGRLISRPIIAEIVRRQREVAREAGCGFWSTYGAMGGPGAAVVWRSHRPPWIGGDLTHPTPEGAEVIGRRLTEALMAGYERYRREHGGGSRLDNEEPNL